MIERGTRILGNVTCSDPVDIRGVLEGDCQTSAHCIVRDGARVLGNIEASAILVAGEVVAGMLKAEKVEVRASARVLATIRARVVAIADGAFFQGEIEIEGAGAASGPPLMKDRRKGKGEDPSLA